MSIYLKEKSKIQNSISTWSFKLVKCDEFDLGPAQPHTFVGIDHGIIFMVILLPFADSSDVVVSYKQKNAHEVLVNHLLVKFA